MSRRCDLSHPFGDKKSAAFEYFFHQLGHESLGVGDVGDIFMKHSSGKGSLQGGLHGMDLSVGQRSDARAVSAPDLGIDFRRQ